jgi:hypothetical protein
MQRWASSGHPNDGRIINCSFLAVSDVFIRVADDSLVSLHFVSLSARRIPLKLNRDLVRTGKSIADVKYPYITNRSVLVSKHVTSLPIVIRDAFTPQR